VDIYFSSGHPHWASPASLPFGKLLIEDSKASTTEHSRKPTTSLLTQDSLNIRFGKSKSAVEESFREAAAHGHKGTLLGYLQGGIQAGKIDINAPDAAGNTALILSTQCGNPWIPLTLIQHKANLDIQNQAGQTALMKAIEFDNQLVLQAIIKAKGNLELKDERGDTALMVATIFSNLEAVRGLLQAKASLNHQNNEGNTALILSILKKPEIFNTLLQAQANPNIQNADGNTALMIATIFGQAKHMKTLIESHCDLEKENLQGNTALSLATAFGKHQEMEILLTAGANIHHQNHEGKTPLDIAKEHQDELALRVLNHQPLPPAPELTPEEQHAFDEAFHTVIETENTED
jgi:ankyrin repeat protein